MATDKTFTVVGVSMLNGEVKVRFANDVSRVKVLAKGGHTDIVLIQLDQAMTKFDAVNFMKDLPEFQSKDAQFAISDFLVKNTLSEKPKREKKVKTPVESESEPLVTAKGEIEMVKPEVINTSYNEVETGDQEDDENVPF